MTASRAIKGVPVLQVILVAQLAHLAWRHLQRLTPAERRRLAQLTRRGRRLPDAERAERRALTAKLESRSFAGEAAHRLSPVPLPRRLTGVGKQQR